MDYTCFHVEIVDAIAIVTFDRPPVNAQNFHLQADEMAYATWPPLSTCRPICPAEWPGSRISVSPSPRSSSPAILSTSPASSTGRTLSL